MPEGPPRETCFFWYHGTCHRGAQCKFAHESHMTWPMAPPPGFVHYEKCNLPLYPLRQDLVGLKKTQENKNITKAAQIGGQMDGAALSFLRRPTIVEIVESDADDEFDDEDYDSAKSDEDSDHASFVSRDYGEYNDVDGDEDSSLASFSEIGRAVSLDDDEYNESDPELTCIEEAEKTFLSSSSSTPLPQVSIEISSDDESDTLEPQYNSTFNEKNQEDAVPSDGLQYVQPAIDATSSEEDRDAPISDIGDDGEDGQSSMPLIDPNSRSMIGSCSSCSDSDEDGSFWRSAVELPSEQDYSFVTAHDPSNTAAELPITNSTDYVDLTCYTPPPPMSSSAVNSPLLSLSHAGTLKRKRTTSPKGYSDDSRKRTKREASSDLDEFTSIMNRQPIVSNSDVTSTAIVSPHPTSTPTSPTHILTSKPEQSLPQARHSENHNLAGFNPRSHTPNGPRALGGRLVCFYWYHKGVCRPKRGKNGRPVQCTYAHTIDGPRPEVSLPPGIDRHDPDCALPLCPVRLNRNNLDLVTNGTNPNGATTRRKTSTNYEPISSPRYVPTALNAHAMSSPQQHVAQERAASRQSHHLTHPSRHYSPYRIGATQPSRQSPTTSVSHQQHTTPIHSPYRGRRPIHKPGQQQGRQRKLQKRQTSTLDYGTELQDPQLRHRLGEYDEEEIPHGRAQTLDSAVEGHIDSFQLINGLIDTVDKVEDDIEKEQNTQNRGDRALDMVQRMKEGRKQETMVPSRRAAMTQNNGWRDPSEEMPKERVCKVLVNYQLPMGEERLPWDTDNVRRVFGEIA
ncbi:hypothetical protein BKA63DRAFT_565631 [Paraphoma chrysanthemicola]|nr:hypothetical protein BKA63DRAFT_565631 [Paraphoma chrysanthemicola]